MQAIYPVFNDVKIASMREKIIEMMQESRDLELGYIGLAPSVRYYKMTESEYQESKSQFYIFTMFLGKFPESASKTEGFAYDIRTLLKEKFILLNESVCYLPLPLSAKRWNFLKTKYANMGDFTYETGKLTFPLYRTELTYIFGNIRTNPTICSSKEGCVPVSLEQLQMLVGLVRLPDESEQNRFGIVKTNIPEPVQVVAPILVVQQQNPEVEKKQEVENRVDLIISSAEKELKDLQIEDNEIFNQLKSEQTKIYVRDLLGKGKTDVHIMSALISDALDSLLKKTQLNKPPV